MPQVFQENEVSLPPPVGDFEGRFHWAGASTGDSGDDPFLLEGWRQVDSRRLAGGFIFGQEMRPAGSRIQDSWIECHWVKICKNPMKQNKDGYSRRCCIPGVVHIILFFWYFRVSHLSLPVNRAIAAHLELHRFIIILLLKWRWICEILLPDTAGVAPQAPSQRAPKVQASEIWAATGIRPQH